VAFSITGGNEGKVPQTGRGVGEVEGRKSLTRAGRVSWKKKRKNFFLPEDNGKFVQESHQTGREVQFRTTKGGASLGSTSPRARRRRRIPKDHTKANCCQPLETETAFSSKGGGSHVVEQHFSRCKSTSTGSLPKGSFLGGTSPPIAGT